MPYVVPNGNDNWEIRESRQTAHGPRSRTLATFKTMTPAIVERAQARAIESVSAEALRAAAHRAGAPVQPAPMDLAAAQLINGMAEGHAPRASLRRLLADSLHDSQDTEASNARAAAAWIGATPKRRGQALRDLLLVVDQLPVAHRPSRKRFPRIASAPA